jgi:PPM family protein phosphatase
MIIKAAGKSDIGLVRAINEDNYKILPEKDLYVVCDGMGGHNAGEVASSLACEIISALYGFHYEKILKDERLRLPRVFPPSTDVLAKSVRIANRLIHKRASSQPEFSGMGTTIVAVAIEGDSLTVLHVGDSRVYRLTEKKLIPLTTDHSWAAELVQTERLSAEEAKTLVNRNVITRALGVKESVDIDVSVRKVVDGDIYIMCSDGLCGYVDDKEIEEALADCQDDPERIVNDLVAMANQRGGSDNVSVVALKVIGKVTPTDLTTLDPVKIDGEAADYYPAEEEWGAMVLDENQKSPQEGKSTSKAPRIAAFIIILLIISAIIYFMVKG